MYINPSELQVLVATSAGPPLLSYASCDLLLYSLLTTAAHIMPKFHHNLMGIGPLCDHGCRILIENTAITVLSKEITVLLKGYHENFGAKLWHFSLCPNNTVSEQCQTGLVAINANDFPSVGTLV